MRTKTSHLQYNEPERDHVSEWGCRVLCDCEDGLNIRVISRGAARRRERLVGRHTVDRHCRLQRTTGGRIIDAREIGMTLITGDDRCLFLVSSIGSLTITTFGLVKSGLQKHLDAGVSDHTVQNELEQPERKANESDLARWRARKERETSI
jgi:hypothetical protein